MAFPVKKALFDCIDRFHDGPTVVSAQYMQVIQKKMKCRNTVGCLAFCRNLEGDKLNLKAAMSTQPVRRKPIFQSLLGSQEIRLSDPKATETDPVDPAGQLRRATRSGLQGQLLHQY
ncbi:uncharacterized protein N7496_006082 [Penicillium cataractarum]|uniref:Uncharacterized protein n=1 Tax=Penicillium cataractarum TaxID=2100454 RepID=A0A9W9S291_9EURO|nr:uncharacterized protein N7496_006082 [Penicillium cataractarum]KAJ5369990.1 hypothetical protein N7496_006082 [Penicillium cataractarum]